MSKLKSALVFIVIALVFVSVYVLTYNLSEPKAYDFMTKHVLLSKLPFDNKQIYGSDDIVLVIIDSKTVEKYRWPWKRDLNCKILEYFYNYAKPSVVVHDSILSTLDADNPESDRKYFNTVAKFDNLIEGFMPVIRDWEDKESGEEFEKAFSRKYGLKVQDEQSGGLILYHSMMPFPKPFMDAVKYAGSVYLPLGALNRNISPWAFDEISRTHEYIVKYDNAYYPSLAMQTYLLLNKDSKILLNDKVLNLNGHEIRLLNKSHIVTPAGNVKFQTISTPLRYYKHYNNGYSHIKYSAVDVMDSYDAMIAGKKPPLDPEIFRDKVVVIGANVPAGTGLNDNKNTPVAANHPGADIQATAIDNILRNDFVRVIPQSTNLVITILGMLLVFVFVSISGVFRSIMSVPVIILGYLLIASACFYCRTVINVITPVVMFVLTTILAYTRKFVVENRSKEKVKSAMGKYMSEDVMKRVIMDIDNLGLGGKRANVTVLFADIRGFTSISEKLSAQEVSQMLNEYFTEMEPIISKYNGIINKFIGDAVMAIFGEPIQDKNHPQNAVKCAYEMLEKVKELKAKWVREGRQGIDIGVGINTGEVFVGNIGSVNRMEYTVIGDTVNLASRLESYNKVYQTKMLISSSTYEFVKGICDVIKISDVQIRGKSQKMDIYEVLKVNIDG